jgi:ParB/RepB/Spo0J family partition protein
MMQPTIEIELQLCRPSPKARQIDKVAVGSLASSVAECGLLTPITVRRAQISSSGSRDGFEVIAGLHRVEAFRRLQRETIPAIILEVDDLHAELMLIDENLYRNDLTPAERASAQARRKAIYQQLHPETKNHAAGNGRTKTELVGQAGQATDGPTPAPRYDEAAADATGHSERTIRRDVTRGEALGEDALAKVARTSLDKGEELDALAKLPTEQREKLINRAAKGEEVSARNLLVNGARAVMGSRSEPEDSLDFFATPPWATRALIEHVFTKLERRGHCKWQNAWEPACGEGHIAGPLREYFKNVVASDIHDYGHNDFTVDFLKAEARPVDWIITNPPFGDVGEAFVLNALRLAGTGVAMFMRVQWLDSIGRYERIFRDRPPTMIAFFAERVPLCQGTWDPNGSTATAYIWLVWIKGAKPRAPFWIPPGCKEKLTRADDRTRFPTKVLKPSIETGSVPDASTEHGMVDDVVLDIPSFLKLSAGTVAPMSGAGAPASTSQTGAG